jgi:signal transduction histidine kinase
MKALSLTIFLSLACSLCFAQNKKKIDSLKHEIAIAKEDTNKVRSLFLLSTYYRFNSLDTALIYFQKSLTLAEKLNDTRGIADGFNMMCRVLTLTGNYPLALEYGLKANPSYEKLKDTANIITNLTGICMCFREQGDYNNALQYALKAYKLSELFFDGPNQIKSTLPSGFSWFNKSYLKAILCSVYEKGNQLDSAIKYGEQSYKIKKDFTGSLYPLANAYSKKGQNEKAMYYFQLGLAVAIKTNLQKDKLEILAGMSDVFKQKGALDSAIVYSKKVLTDKFVKNFPVSLFVASTQLANIYETQNKTDSAFKYLKQSIAFKDTLFNKGKMIAIQNLIFKEDQKKKELEDAELKFQNRLKIYGLIGGISVLLLLSFLLWRRNLYKQKAYNLLQSQKKEIDIQKIKVEQTLEKLKSTQAQLIQSEKLASLGELTAGIAHEIQNPLNFVNNFSEVSSELLEELKSPLTPVGGIKPGQKIDMEVFEDLTQNLEKITLHGKRASSIVKGMLEHSRASTGEKELTEINALADEYLRLAYHGSRAKDSNFNATLETHFDENLPKIEVIPQDMGRVLLNLINNAIYAVKSVDKPMVKVSTMKVDDKIVISVKDNGTGMTNEVKSKIFQPFFTTKPTGQGTGLGLSLAYDIITKGHGGTLEVESIDGEGTEFIISLNM